MQLFLDTNILLRAMKPEEPNDDSQIAMVLHFKRHGYRFVTSPQCMYEYYAVATRSTMKNGLGLTPSEALRDIASFQELFEILMDGPNTLRQWTELVERYGVKGIHAHDAHIVASMLTHDVAYLLTMNRQDFAPFVEIQLVEPYIHATPAGSVT